MLHSSNVQLTFRFAVPTAGSFIFAVLIYRYSIHVAFHLTTFTFHPRIHVHLSHIVSNLVTTDATGFSILYSNVFGPGSQLVSLSQVWGAAGNSHVSSSLAFGWNRKQTMSVS